MTRVTHFVVGPWGSGKTELANALRGRVEGVVVLEWDSIIPALSLASGKDVHSDPSTWPGLAAAWEAIVREIVSSGLGVVLIGPVGPAVVQPSGDGGVRCAYLDCPDETLRTRLLARGEPENHIADELATARDLRRSGWRRIDADRSVADIAADVETWIRTHE